MIRCQILNTCYEFGHSPIGQNYNEMSTCEKYLELSQSSREDDIFRKKDLTRNLRNN